MPPSNIFQTKCPKKGQFQGIYLRYRKLKNLACIGNFLPEVNKWGSQSWKWSNNFHYFRVIAIVNDWIAVLLLFEKVTLENVFRQSLHFRLFSFKNYFWPKSYSIALKPGSLYYLLIFEEYILKKWARYHL